MNLLIKKSKSFLSGFRDESRKVSIDELRTALGENPSTSKIERFLASRCNLSRSSAKAVIHYIQADYFKIASK